MAHKLFSKTLVKYTEEITNQALLDSLSLLKNYLGIRNLILLKWDDNRIAIPLTLSIELPSFRDIDIREKEQILIVISAKYYPSICPIVYTDRLDFPKNQLAHLYIAKDGKPPGFCLIKGDMTSWYAYKHLKDIVIRTKHWLSDAASDSLSEDNNQFDPLRLEGYSGSVVYKYHEFAEIVNNNKSFISASNFAIAVFENTTNEGAPTFILKNIVIEGKVKESLKEYNDARKKLSEKAMDVPKISIGYCLWSREVKEFKDYDVNLPGTWRELKEYCARYKIDLAELEKFICEYKLDYLLEIPVVVGIKRPKQIIGFNSSIEFINFYLIIKTDDKDDEKIKDDVIVKFQEHNEPLSVLKAQEVSGTQYNLSNSTIFGCGALGSKIVMHFTRNGYTDYLLVDPDKISPHNMVRYGLTANVIGEIKSKALLDEGKKLFPYDKLNGLSFSISGEGAFAGKLVQLIEKGDWLFDFTASESFFNILVNSKVITNPKVCRVIISDFGNKGIMYLEGKNRNPRLDDLLVSLYSQSLENSNISNWLQAEYNVSENNKTLISVGVGCNSETTILSDEVISLHASYHSGLIKKLSNSNVKENDFGSVYISDIVNKEEQYSVQNLKLTISPFDVFSAINDNSWQIRYRAGIIAQLKSEMGMAMPNETGGIFIGSINYKTKTIHVLDIVNAPTDSSSSPVCFFRGISGLPDKIKEINIKSGFQLGYIGEWHTHPFGPNALSATDMNTVRKFKKEFSNLPTPLPVFISILTPMGLLPFVY